MKKITIIYGKQGSGKTDEVLRMAQEAPGYVEFYYANLARALIDQLEDYDTVIIEEENVESIPFWIENNPVNHLILTIQDK